MNPIFIFIGISLIVVAVIVVLLRSISLHQEICSPEHLESLVQNLKTIKADLIKRTPSFDIEELKKAGDPKERIAAGHTSKKLILTYLTTIPPDGKILHCFSISWGVKKLPIRSAALLSSVIIHTMNMEETWNKELKLSNSKMPIFHFLFSLTPEENETYINTPTRNPHEIQELMDAVKKYSFEVQLTRKKDQSSSG